MNIKKFIAGAVAGVLMLGAMVTPVFAVAPNWDVTGNWKFNFEYLGAHYEHSASLTQTGSIVNGNGGYPADGTPYQYHWNITSGGVVGNQLNLVMTYDLGVSTCTMAMDGSIFDGTITNGTWSDNCWGIQRNGTWVSSFGTAKAIVATCPAGTTQTFLETINVPSNSSVVTPSSNVLLSGKDYLVVSSGTWQNNNLNVADTEFASVDGWVTQMDGYNIAPYFLGEGEFDLQINSAFIDWGGYNSAHTYSHLYTGTGSQVNFLVFDGNSNTSVLEPGWYSDNSGSLTVSVYSCNPEKINLPTNKDQCKKDGWKAFKVFKNQGDCVSFVVTGGKNLPAYP